MTAAATYMATQMTELPLSLLRSRSNTEGNEDQASSELQMTQANQIQGKEDIDLTEKQAVPTPPAVQLPPDSGYVAWLTVLGG